MNKSASILPENLVIFDGVCNLCEFSVQFIAERDAAGRFFFTPAQSPLGQSLLRQFGISATNLDTVVLVKQGRAYTRSAAAMEIAAMLDMPWNLLAAFQAVPEPLRDLLYDLIAQNRYQLFGKKEECMLPSEGVRHRFLEEIPA